MFSLEKVFSSGHFNGQFSLFDHLDHGLYAWPFLQGLSKEVVTLL